MSYGDFLYNRSSPNFITCCDIADRLWRKWSVLSFSSIELVGAEKEFGYILVDNKVKLTIYIHDAEAIMWVLENFMYDVDSYIQDAIDRHLEMQ